MKKNITNIISPFIMLLIPLFLLLGVLAMNVNNQLPAEKHNASLNLQVPTLKSFFQAMVKK